MTAVGEERMIHAFFCIMVKEESILHMETSKNGIYG
jgi:hypothetical protein